MAKTVTNNKVVSRSDTGKATRAVKENQTVYKPSNDVVPGGGIPKPPPDTAYVKGTNPYENFYDNASSGINTAYQQLLLQMQNERNAQIGQVNQLSDDSQRQNYIAKEKSLYNIPKQMLRMGLSGGASETALTGVGVGYGNNRNSTEKQRTAGINDANSVYNKNASNAAINYQNQLSALQQRQSELNASYEIEEQRRADDYKKFGYSQFVDDRNYNTSRIDEADNDAKYSEQQKKDDERYEYGKSNSEKDNSYAKNQKAKEEAWKYGDQYGDYSGMSKFGWSKSQIANATKVWKDANKSSGGSGGKGGGGKSGGNSYVTYKGGDDETKKGDDKKPKPKDDYGIKNHVEYNKSYDYLDYWIKNDPSMKNGATRKQNVGDYLQDRINKGVLTQNEAHLIAKRLGY